MPRIREKLGEFGLEIPPPQVVPPGTRLIYRRLVRHGPVVYIAGHGPTLGAAWGYLGKVDQDISIEDAVLAAQLTALNVLGTLERELGDLDSVGTWLKITGYVNAPPDFTEQARVINGFSDLILNLYGPDRLAARTAVGVSSLPFGMPVEVDAVVAWEGD